MVVEMMGMHYDGWPEMIPTLVPTFVGCCCGMIRKAAVSGDCFVERLFVLCRTRREL